MAKLGKRRVRPTVSIEATFIIAPNHFVYILCLSFSVPCLIVVDLITIQC